MSRTYRNHSLYNHYPSVEVYSARNRRWAWCARNPYIGPEDVRDWYEWKRDGKSYDGSANRDYRNFTNKVIRGSNRKNIGKLFNDLESYDDMDFATKRHGKHIAWVIW